MYLSLSYVEALEVLGNRSSVLPGALAKNDLWVKINLSSHGLLLSNLNSREG